jgi:hypothetical protein
MLFRKVSADNVLLSTFASPIRNSSADFLEKHSSAFFFGILNFNCPLGVPSFDNGGAKVWPRAPMGVLRRRRARSGNDQIEDMKIRPRDEEVPKLLVQGAATKRLRIN